MAEERKEGQVEERKLGEKRADAPQMEYFCDLCLRSLGSWREAELRYLEMKVSHDLLWRLTLCTSCGGWVETMLELMRGQGARLKSSGLTDASSAATRSGDGDSGEEPVESSREAGITMSDVTLGASDAGREGSAESPDGRENLLGISEDHDPGEEIELVEIMGDGRSRGHWPKRSEFSEGTESRRDRSSETKKWLDWSEPKY